MSQEETARWKAPAALGSVSVQLDPPDGGPGGIRLIQDTTAVAPPAFRSYGWAALELVVADLDRMVQRLMGSAFELVAPPAPVGGNSAALRAAQFAAPGGAGLYLTEIRFDPPGFSLPRTITGVGRMYIAVLASPDLEADRAALEERFAVARVTDHPLPIRAINRSFGFEPTRLHRLSTLQLAGQSALEIDQYPPEAVRRRWQPGHLPPGIALVTAAAPRRVPELVCLPGGAWLETIGSTPSAGGDRS